MPDAYLPHDFEIDRRWHVLSRRRDQGCVRCTRCGKKVVYDARRNVPLEEKLGAVLSEACPGSAPA